MAIDAIADRSACSFTRRISVRLLLFWFVFRLELAAAFDPGVPSSFERAHFFVAFIEQHLRHTGARMLARSGAVDDDLFVARDLVQVRFDVTRSDANCAFDLLIRPVIRPLTA